MKANKLKDLTWLFFINIFISSFTFGGGYVVVSMVRKYFVEKRKIFNESDLITMSAISQTTPGAIAINLAALAGYKVAGTIGTIVSCIGAIIPPITILAVVSLWYQVFSTNHIIMAILKGMQAGIAAIIVDILIGMTRAINEQHSKLLTAISIGGGYAIIPLIQEQVVNNYHWISANTFTDIITISQMTPGPLAVNTSTFVGIQLAGISGAIVATIGCIFAGATISIILYLLFTKYQKLEIITNILNTLKATSVGLIMSAGATILILTFVENNSINFLAIIIFVISLLWLQKKKPNPIALMIITGIIGYFVY